MFRLLTIFFLLTLVACDKNNDPNTEQQDYQAVLKHIAEQVIVPTYKSLNDQSIVLSQQTELFKNQPTEANLALARQAWRDARVPWEQSEGFLFGPVSTQGIDPSIDSWPVNEVDLDAVLASSAVLTQSYIDGLEGTLKGFHTIEYLLFGLDSNKPISNFTPRELEYLVAVTQSLAGATNQLYLAWDTNGQNYANQIASAGESGSIYLSQKSALEEIANGLITIADEVANGKINDPYATQNLTLEESRFSANSKADFADNIRSIRNIYYGQFNNSAIQNGFGIAISDQNTTLDSKIKIQIDEAIAAIEAIDGTFTYAVINSRNSIQIAQNKVRLLQETLQTELLPIISNL